MASSILIYTVGLGTFEMNNTWQQQVPSAFLADLRCVICVESSRLCVGDQLAGSVSVRIIMRRRTLSCNECFAAVLASPFHAMPRSLLTCIALHCMYIYRGLTSL